MFYQGTGTKYNRVLTLKNGNFENINERVNTSKTTTIRHQALMFVLTSCPHHIDTPTNRCILTNDAVSLHCSQNQN